MISTRILAVLLVALLTAAWGCSGSDGDGAKTADELFSEGISYLEESMQDVNVEDPPWEWSADMAEANAFFEEALAEDPDHCGALLMAALTRLVMVLQDPELGEILDSIFPEEGARAEGPATLVFRAFERPDVYAVAAQLREARQGGFHFSELQDFIEDEVVPALGYADGNLTQFEAMDCVVLLEIDVEEKREVMEIEIDATDVLVLHAALDVVQSLFHMAVSYNVDTDEGQTLQELIDEDSDFLALRAGNHMPAAYDELFEAVDHLELAATSLENETDDQYNDILTASDDEGWVPMGVGAADTIAMLASEMEEALTSGVTYNPWEDTGEPGAPDIDVTVDLAELFNDPLAQLTDYFPEHTWPSPDSMEVAYPYVFPDPTFSDITPGMTNAAWTEIIDWLEGE